MPPFPIKIATLSGLFLLLFGCADYQLHFNEAYIPDQPLTAPQGPPEFSTFFVGDLGYQPVQGMATLRAMAEALAAFGPNGSLLLLGDIMLPDGLSSKDDPVGTAYLDQLIQVTEKIPGRIYYTPGENELGRRGDFDRLQQLEKYLKERCGKKIQFLPKDACSGPKDKQLHPGVGLIGVSTAWYLAEWNRNAEVSEGCEFNDRGDFILALADEVKRYRDQVKIVMLHHSLASNGNRGGMYSVRQHVFPLSDLVPGAFIPLPGLGSLARGLQASGGNRHDLTNLRYRDLINRVLSKTEDEENLIFIGAHEHNLFYRQKDNYHLISAGSGSRATPAAGGKGTGFAYGEVGYGRLDFYADGSVYLSFYSVDASGRTEQIIQQRIIENRYRRAAPDLPPIAAEQVDEKTVASPVYETPYQKKTGLYRSLFGEHYRELYFLPVTVPVLNMDSLHGGLRPYRRGGGQSTQSLHLQGGDGHLYQFRSVRKNPAQLLPGPLERTFAAELVRDQFTAVHPFAPLTLPPMQEALGLLGAKPQLYYVPKQSALRDFNANFGGEMYWLEQRPDEDWSGTGLFANSTDIISNSKAREAINDSWKHQADQRNYLRARLFDHLIGDWDRHRDQWRWATQPAEDGTVRYLPIGRDRDQVFSNFDGILINLSQLAAAEARKLNPFGYRLNKPKWRALNGKWNDRVFLNELTQADFQAEAAFIVETLTDSLIDHALARLPPEVRPYSLQQEDIDGKLKLRRDQLLKFANGYYKVLARIVTVTATNKDDVIQLTAAEGGNVRLQLFDADSTGRADELYYDRTFSPAETKEIRVYGLDGDDQFVLDGTRNCPILIRLIGGTDQDVVRQRGQLKARVYDAKSGMALEGKGIFDRRNNRHPELNLYHFEEYRPDHLTPVPNFGYNVDDEFFIGLGLNFRKFGFRPDPYGANHFLGASFSTNGTFQMDYEGELNNTFGRYRDLLIDLRYRSPDYVVNFFGLGNESANPSPVREFNRSRQERRYLSPTLRLRGRKNRLSLSISPFYEYFKIDRGDAQAEQTLISQPGIVPERVFQAQNFGGVRLDFSFNNLAVPHMPDNGLTLKAHLVRNYNLTTRGRALTKFGGELAYYQFFGDQVIGLASRIGMEHIDGEFEFYQATRLGGRTNFRAARSERFLGNTVFYHNTDLRIRGFGFGKNAANASGGFLLGLDYGRVWLSQESSDRWHVGFGGGLWVAPFNAAIISATFFTSKVGRRLNIGSGFPF